MNLPGLLADLNDLAAAIIAAARADHVGALHLAAVVTCDQRQWLELVVLTAAATPAFG